MKRLWDFVLFNQKNSTSPHGAFHRVRHFHDGVFLEIFTHEVLCLLLRQKLIGLPLVNKILGRRHTGFNVHSKVRARPSHPLIIEDDPAYVPSKGWAEMIRKVYKMNPLLCPSCGGQMSVISFIEEPKTIDRIIRHLELTLCYVNITFKDIQSQHSKFGPGDNLFK